MPYAEIFHMPMELFGFKFLSNTVEILFFIQKGNAGGYI